MFGMSEFLMGALSALPLEAVNPPQETRKERILGIVFGVLYIAMEATFGLAFIGMVFVAIKLILALHGVPFP